jgi:hypothetical protein
MTILAVSVPTSLGVKVALIVQLAPGAKVAGETGQVLVEAKSLASVPAIVILEIVYATLSLFVRTADSGVALFVPWA